MYTQTELNQEAAQVGPDELRPSVSRRMFVGAAALAGAGFIGATACQKGKA
jgi:hypothetical protein